MKIGFTGTRAGMTPLQMNRVKILLIGGTELHDGDCIGADSQAFFLAKSQGLRTVCHPPLKSAKRAFNVHDETRPPYEYLTRNHHIVGETRLLIVAPRDMEEQLKSGTWATYRYAKKLRAPRIIVFPDGSTKS